MRVGAHIAAVLGLAVVVASPAPARALKLGYLYDLSDTTGPIRESPGDVWYDREHNEIFVVGYGVVRVFNQTGMETYSFRLDPSLGQPMSVAQLDSGDLLVLSRRGSDSALSRCNFRGEACEVLALSGLPADWQDSFHPNELRRAAGRLYLADLNAMRVAVIDDRGAVVAHHDLAQALDFEDKRADLGLSGFDVARDGTLLFTIAPLFRAYAMSTDGTVRTWGTPGGAPGKFNVVKGVVADDRGHFFVLDALKSAVIAFDGDLRFVGEFGYRGNRPGNLASPSKIAFGEGRIFVAQNGGKGIAVFRIHDE